MGEGGGWGGGWGRGRWRGDGGEGWARVAARGSPCPSASRAASSQATPWPISPALRHVEMPTCPARATRTRSPCARRAEAAMVRRAAWTLSRHHEVIDLWDEGGSPTVGEASDEACRVGSYGRGGCMVRGRSARGRRHVGTAGKVRHGGPPAVACHDHATGWMGGRRAGGSEGVERVLGAGEGVVGGWALGVGWVVVGDVWWRFGLPAGARRSRWGGGHGGGACVPGWQGGRGECSCAHPARPASRRHPHPPPCHPRPALARALVDRPPPRPARSSSAAWTDTRASRSWWVGRRVGEVGMGGLTGEISMGVGWGAQGVGRGMTEGGGGEVRGGRGEGKGGPREGEGSGGDRDGRGWQGSGGRGETEGGEGRREGDNKQKVDERPTPPMRR